MYQESQDAVEEAPKCPLKVISFYRLCSTEISTWECYIWCYSYNISKKFLGYFEVKTSLGTLGTLGIGKNIELA